MTDTAMGRARHYLFENPDRASGLFVVALACIALVASADLPYGSIQKPDAGFFPRTLSVLLFIFGVAIYIKSFFASTVIVDFSAQTWRVLIAAVALCAYAVTISRVGFVVDTILIMMLMMRGFGGMSWKMSSAIAVSSVLVSYLGFVELGVPLPRGILPF